MLYFTVTVLNPLNRRDQGGVRSLHESTLHGETNLFCWAIVIVARGVVETVGAFIIPETEIPVH